MIYLLIFVFSMLSNHEEHRKLKYNKHINLFLKLEADVSYFQLKLSQKKQCLKCNFKFESQCAQFLGPLVINRDINQFQQYLIL